MSKATSTTAGVEQAAVRRVIYGLAELDGELVNPEETPLVEAASMGLENLEEMTARMEQLEAKTDALEERAPEPSKKQYEDMDRSDKATVVQSKLRKEAESTTGAAKAGYKDIIRMFDGHPSPGHAYDIMETAAEGEGFNQGTDPEGTKRLTFNKQRV